jgi:hypothetical protein
MGAGEVQVDFVERFVTASGLVIQSANRDC